MGIKSITMKQLFFILSFTLFVSGYASSQTDDNQNKYLLGKDLLKQGRYSAAMETFKIVLARDPNEYINLSRYFYSLAAFKAGRLDDANKMLRTLMAYAPTWDKRDDIYYLLANIAFEQGNASLALKLLQDK